MAEPQPSGCSFTLHPSAPYATALEPLALGFIALDRVSFLIAGKC